jgi:hypothetical protein
MDYRVGVGALHAPFDPLEDLHNSAVLGLARGNRPSGRQSLGTQQRNVFPCKLQQVGFFAWFGFVGYDDNGATGFCLHIGSPRFYEERLSEFAGVNG